MPALISREALIFCFTPPPLTPLPRPTPSPLEILLHPASSDAMPNSVGKSVTRTRSFHVSHERLVEPSSNPSKVRAGRARSLQFEFDRVSSSSSSGANEDGAVASAGDDNDREADRKCSASVSKTDGERKREDHLSPAIARKLEQLNLDDRETGDVGEEEDGDDDDDGEGGADSNDDASSTDTFLNGVTSLEIRGRRRTGSRANSGGSDTLSVHTLVACEDAALEDFKNAFRNPTASDGGKENLDDTLTRETRSEDEGAGEKDLRAVRSASSPAPPLRSASLPTLSYMVRETADAAGTFDRNESEERHLGKTLIFKISSSLRNNHFWRPKIPNSIVNESPHCLMDFRGPRKGKVYCDFSQLKYVCSDVCG